MYFVSNSSNSAKKLSEMALHRKYYNSIKFMVHMADTKDKRQMMISQIAYANPYLCAQIIMTICEDTRKEEKYLLDIIERRLESVSNKYKKMFSLMALSELGETRKFEEEILKNIDLIDFKTLNFFANNSNGKQLLMLIRALLKADKTRYVSTMVQKLEKGYSNENDSEVIELAKLLAGSEQITLSYKLLRAARLDYDVSKVLGLKKEYLEAKALERVPFSSEDDFEAYLNIKYGFLKRDIENGLAWKTVIEKESPAIWGDRLLKKYLKANLLSKDMVLGILKMKGIDEADR